MFGLDEYLVFQVHGGAEHGSIITLVENLLTTLESAVGHSGTDTVSSLLPGVAGMVNFHPLAVHFPIALLVMFFLVELAGFCFGQKCWRSVASGLLYLGTVCAALAVYLGLQAADTVAHDEAVHVIMEKHEAFGIAILSLAVFLSLWRLIFGAYRHWIAQLSFLLMAGILNVLILLGADLGGVMVYQHGVAVRIPAATAIVAPGAAAEGSHEHNHESHEHSHSDHTH